jgi:hypothetical protein
MYRFFLCFICFSLVSIFIVQSSISEESVGSVYEKTCTITEIKGQVVTTSCRQFTLSEEMKITDISGRPVLLYQIPLPCTATIEYTCVSDKSCTSIVSIMLLQKIKVVPE